MYGQGKREEGNLSNSGGVAFKLPGAASLYEQLDKLILVCLRDGRNFMGYLRSFDQYANLVLDKTVERLTDADSFADVPIGIFVIRGENVMLLGEVDAEKDRKVRASMREVSEAELKASRKSLESSDLGARSIEKPSWPIPEDY